jgi:hypothetical protein
VRARYQWPTLGLLFRIPHRQHPAWQALRPQQVKHATSDSELDELGAHICAARQGRCQCLPTSQPISYLRAQSVTHCTELWDCCFPGCHVWMPPTSSEEANSGPQPAAAAAGFNLARSEPQDQQLHFNKTSDASSAQHEADQGPSIPAHPAASTPVRGAAMKKTASYVSIAHCA